MADSFTGNDSDYHRVLMENVNGPDNSQIIVGVVFLFLMVFGLFFNTAVIHTFRLTSSLQTPTNVLIIGLAASDTAMIVLGHPFVIASSFHGSWMFGNAWCEGYGFVTALIGVSNICILSAVALDRYFVVTKSPMAVKITTFKAVMTILTCFGYGLLWATFPLVGWGSYVIEPNLLSCGPDWANESPSSKSFSITIFVLVFLVPICIIFFCYSQIIITVRGNKVAAIEQMPSVRQVEIKVAFSVFLTILTFLAAWTPYAVMSFWCMANNIKKLNPTVAMIAPLLAKSASVWNPLVYVARNKEFRAAFISIIFRSIIRNRSRGRDESPGGSDLPNVRTVNTVITHVDNN